MVQVQQVAAAQEEAVVLAQALLDRERVAAEEREKAQLQAQLAAAQSAGENAQLIAELKDSLKTTTEAFMHALGSSGGGVARPVPRSSRRCAESIPASFSPW